MPATKSRSSSDRVVAIDWAGASADLDAQGWAILPRLLPAPECDAMVGLYENDERFRSQVIMARHGFGRGEYRYFAYPLPALVEAPAHRPLPAPRADRQPMARSAWA